MITKEQIDTDLKRFEQMRFESLLGIRNPEAALLNYHRCDAVMAYIKELQGKLEEIEKAGVQEEKENG